MATSILMNGNRKTTVLVQLATLLLLTIIVPTATSSPIPVHRHRRIGRPCAGSTESDSFLSTVGLPTSETVSQSQLNRAIRSITRLFGALYDDVIQLKSDYGTERDVVYMGMHFEGVPHYNGIHFASPLSHDDNLVASVAEITTKLSRVAVIISLLRLEEDRHEPLPFSDELQLVEDHAEHGLYGILCRLHIIHRLASSLNLTNNDLRVDLTVSVDAVLKGAHLEEAKRPAHRHLRTYAIIHDVALLLQRIIVVFNDFAA